MPVVQPSFKPQITTGAKAKQVSNISVTTDTPLALPDLTKQVIVKARGSESLTISESIGGDYFTIPSNTVLTLDNMELSATILYISSSTPATMVEVIILYG